MGLHWHWCGHWATGKLGPGVSSAWTLDTTLTPPALTLGVTRPCLLILKKKILTYFFPFFSNIRKYYHFVIFLNIVKPLCCHVLQSIFAIKQMEEVTKGVIT